MSLSGKFRESFVINIGAKHDATKQSLGHTGICLKNFKFVVLMNLYADLSMNHKFKIL